MSTAVDILCLPKKVAWKAEVMPLDYRRATLLIKGLIENTTAEVFKNIVAVKRGTQVGSSRLRIPHGGIAPRAGTPLAMVVL